VAEYLQIFRARVPQQSLAALLEIRLAAIAEAQRLCPELLRAQLVRLDDGTWLDVLTRSLGHLDAQDACQEIQVRIVTRLGSFEGRSRFTTWAYTVAVRSLLRTRKRLVEASVQGAEAFAAFLDVGMGEVDPTLEKVEYRLLLSRLNEPCPRLTEVGSICSSVSLKLAHVALSH
jgi:hypothetical protein